MMKDLRWPVNIIYCCVKVCIYEGADKYDKFSARIEEIRQQVEAIVDSGIEVHGRTFPVRKIMGGDAAFLSLAYGHACPLSTHRCRICSQGN
jgi:hypothetical protein